MYTVYIADDEGKVISGLINRVHWDALDASVIGYAKDGSEAAERIAELNPDIVITDILMPGQTGLQLMDRLKETCDAVFIIFSAYSEFEYAREALQMDAVDYLIKPANISEIEATIKKAIEKFRSKKLSRFQNEEESLLQDILNGNMQAAQDRIFRQYESFFIIQLKLNDSRNTDSIIACIRTWLVMDGKLFLIQSGARLTLLIAQRNALSAGNARKKVIGSLKTLQATCENNFYWGLGCIVDAPENLPTSLLAAEEMLEYCAFSLSQLDNDPAPEPSPSAPIDLREAESLLLLADAPSQAYAVLAKVKETIQLQNNSANDMKAQIVDFAYRLRTQFESAYENIDDSSLDWNRRVISPLLAASNLDLMCDILQDFIAFLYEYASSCTGSHKQRHHVARIRQYILEHLASSINLNDLAREINRNPSYISYIFKQETGPNLFDYITQERIRHAKYLLKNTDLRILDIARACGYEDQSYFSQVFRKHTGATAGEFRKGI